MGGIFINYRSTAPHDVVSGMYRRLADYFGEEQVFRDEDSIRPGHTYWEVIEARVVHSEVLLAVIHKEWVTEVAEDGTRLLDQERDWVREEIELALEHHKKIIPVLVDDTDPLTESDLPESIRDIRGKQGPRVRADSLDADVTRLIEQLKRDVAKTWKPSNAGTQPPWRPGRWLAYLTGLLALVVLAGPAILVRNDSPAGEDEVPPLFPLAVQSIFIMLAVPIIFWLVHVPFGGLIRSGEREAQRAPARRYNVMIIPTVLMFMFILIYLTIASGTSPAGQLFVFTCLFLSTLWAASIALRNERVDRELDRGWPHEIGHLPRPPALRRAMVRFEERLTEWRRPLSREQEDKATYMLAQLTGAANRLSDATTRRQWVLAGHRWGLSGYTVWISVSVGFVLASAVPEVRAGAGSPSRWVLLVTASALVCLSIAALTVEVGYRLHLRWRRTMVTEVGAGVQRLEGRLKVLMELPPWESPGR